MTDEEVKALLVVIYRALMMITAWLKNYLDARK